MPRHRLLVWALLAASAVGGCAPTDVTDAPAAPDEAPAAVADNGSAPPAPTVVAAVQSTAPESPSLEIEGQTFAGSVRGTGQFQLFDLAAGEAGDQIEVMPQDSVNGYVIVALFDAQMNLVARAYVTGRWGLTHIMRETTSKVFLGVTPASDGRGADFRLRVTRRAGVGVPPAQPQAVYLNFEGAAGLSVNQRLPVSFGPFDGADIGPAYANHTAELRAVIVRTIREDYAGYNVAIVSSDDGPAPAGAHATVHFGGSGGDLLGLADGVDAYNSDPGQNAIVYTASFAPYRTMRLSAEQMGVMIGNVGSHELGHLLGLYHTADGHDVMDTVGTAWDLAGSQSFTRTALEENVFPLGYEDSPRLLLQTVGPAKLSAKTVPDGVRPGTANGWVRRLVQQELPHTCGTCLSLDP